MWQKFQRKITAVGEGTAIITVSMGTKEATCTVTVTDSAVCKTALKLLDAQYIWGGNGPQDGGVDCSGLLMYAYTQNGYDFGADLNADNFAGTGRRSAGKNCSREMRSVPVITGNDISIFYCILEMIWWLLRVRRTDGMFSGIEL